MAEKWTEQKVFNKCAKHMLFGKNWCRNEHISVDLETRTFKTCAVGNLPSMKTQINYATHVIDKGFDYGKDYYDEMNEAENVNYLMISDIIDINDGAKRSRFGEKLRALAREYHLKIPDFLLKENLGR